MSHITIEQVISTSYHLEFV